MKRLYIPNVGDRVKFKAMPYYVERGITIWAWLRVVERNVSDPENSMLVQLEVLDGDRPTGKHVSVSPCLIQPPLGWKPVYEITCKDQEQAMRVVSDWFERGIHVWASHDLSSAGRMAFTPVDQEHGQGKPASPHWQYTGQPVETIWPGDCSRLFTVSVLHEWEPELPPTSEPTARRRAVRELRSQPGVTLDFLRTGWGTIAVCQRTEVIHQASR